MDPGGRATGYQTGWETLMATILDTALPLVPQEYDFEMMIRLVGTLENALTRVEIPEVISGLDDTNGVSWFMD
jgi:hypothetical protein